MPIKMRHNDDPDAVCDNCGNKTVSSLNMFDLCIGETVFTLCDLCNGIILDKTLAAEVFKNGRLKSPQDMRIIRSRAKRK